MNMKNYSLNLIFKSKNLFTVFPDHKNDPWFSNSSIFFLKIKIEGVSYHILNKGIFYSEQNWSSKDVQVA